MKSILFFSEQLGGGGAEAILKDMVPKLNKEKYNISVVAQIGSKNYCFKHKSWNLKGNNALAGLINKIIVKFTLNAPEHLIKKLFIHRNYDVEIAFCEGNATRLVGNWKSKPCAKKIAWVHTDVINNPWSEFVFGGPDAEKRCYENFDAIICVSQTMKDAFIKKYGMENKVHVLYNIIDFNVIKERGKESAEVAEYGDLCFGMVGRLVAVKGYNRILEAVERLKNDGYKFSVNIIGAGEDFENLKNFVAEHQLEKYVHFLGFQDNPNKFVSKCDAYICSSYAEGYSTTVTEAIVLGVPVITTDVSGMREIFGNKECGIICENSTDGLYKSLKYVLDNPEVLRGFAKNASERAKDFDINKRIADVENLLDNM